MATVLALIVTPYAGDGLTPATAFKPAVAGAFALLGYRDVTGHPTSSIPPNTPAGEAQYCILARLDDTVLTAIAAAGYPVIWSGAPAAGDPNNPDPATGTVPVSGAAWATLRARLVAAGYPAGVVAALTGTDGQYTRAQLLARLLARMRAATKR